MIEPFDGFYRGKTVFVTGDTGFKGSWLVAWLTHLGARVVGYSLEPPTDPNNFSASRLTMRYEHVHGDVRDAAHLDRVIAAAEPDVMFHLAAQPLVRLSYREPRQTFEVNVIGTVNALEAARLSGSVRAVVVITSDKCYRNVNWAWGYRESDELGGYDPYSASKACAELAVSVYQDPRFQQSVSSRRELAVASVRAGNVIGGGDWALDRIVPDTIRALTRGEDIVLRNPNATRPWQHVLEPLSGYLWLGAQLASGAPLASSYNFGPPESSIVTVHDLVSWIVRAWSTSSTRIVVESDESAAECQLLRLDCSKALQLLRWRPVWGAEGAVEALVEWYEEFYRRPGADMYGCSTRQIDEYVRLARAGGIRWAGEQPATLTADRKHDTPSIHV